MDKISQMDHCPFCGESIEPGQTVCSNQGCEISLLPRLLVDWEIERLLENGELVIDPLLRLRNVDENSDDAQLGPGSIDLRLDTTFKEFRLMNKPSIDLRTPQPEEELYRLLELDMSRDENYILHPGEFVLAQSLEYIVMPDCISGRLDGRSSYGRYGVMVHSTAGSVDAGFRGHLAFELSNLGKMPVHLHPTVRVARMSLFLTSKCENPYRGKFQLQVRIKPPVPD
jgi:dCTP deaminase